MGLYRDLSGNGAGVTLESHMNTIDLSAADATVPGKSTYLRAGGAGDIVVRPAGGDADITLAAAAGEYIPIDPGSKIRKTGTTATNIVAVNS